MIDFPNVPSGINSLWLGYNILSIYSGIQFAKILLRTFTSMFMKNAGLQFSYNNHVRFWYPGPAVIIESLGTIQSLAF